MYGGKDHPIQDIKDSDTDMDMDMDTMAMEVSATDGLKVITINRWTDSNKLITQEDGEINMTKDYNKTFIWSSRDTIRIEVDNWKDKSSSMPTEISASKWEWLLPITINKSPFISFRFIFLIVKSD